MNTMREKLEQWAAEQGFEAWAADHDAVLRNLAAWFDRAALAARPEASEGTELDALREENARLRALFAKYRDAIASIHRSDWSDDVGDYTRHTEEDDCWICDMIIPVDAALAKTQATPAPEQGEGALREAARQAMTLLGEASAIWGELTGKVAGIDDWINRGFPVYANLAALLSRQSAEEPLNA